MGFDDLPIPNNGSVYNASSPLGLATVANYTKNPVLDIGYQCKDSRPYFAFVNSSTTYYIKIHPDNLGVNDEVGIYSASSITKFGITYTKMTRLSGKATVTSITPSVTLRYNSVTYTYTPGSNTDVFLNKLNTWSFYKPYDYTGVYGDEYGQTRDNDLINGTHNWDDAIKRRTNGACYGFNYDKIRNDVTNVYCQTYTIALNNAAATNSEWYYIRPTTIYRLTDFIGYNKNAICAYGSDTWSPLKEIHKVANSRVGLSYTWDREHPDYEINIFTIDDTFRNTNWYVGAIVSRVRLSGGSVADRLSTDYYNAGALNTLFPSTGSSTINVEMEALFSHGEGDYEVCWVLAKGNSSTVTDNQPFVILPHGYSLFNYDLMNMAVTIVPYYANFTSTTTSPSADWSDQPLDITWGSIAPPRKKSDEVCIDYDYSMYISVKFFFTVRNNNKYDSLSATLTIDKSITDSIGSIVKNITIPANSSMVIGVEVPFIANGNPWPQLFGNGIDGDVNSGVGFRISMNYAGNLRYLNMETGDLQLANPGYQYLYNICLASGHWLLDNDATWIWTQSGNLSTDAPTLDDNRIIMI